MAVLPKTFEEYDKRKDDLKEWFGKFGNWQEIDANQNIQELHVSFASIIGEKIVEKKKFMENEKEMWYWKIYGLLRFQCYTE